MYVLTTYFWCTCRKIVLNGEGTLCRHKKDMHSLTQTANCVQDQTLDPVVVRQQSTATFLLWRHCTKKERVRCTDFTSLPNYSTSGTPCMSTHWAVIILFYCSLRKPDMSRSSTNHLLIAIFVEAWCDVQLTNTSPMTACRWTQNLPYSSISGAVDRDRKWENDKSWHSEKYNLCKDCWEFFLAFKKLSISCLSNVSMVDTWPGFCDPVIPEQLL